MSGGSSFSSDQSVAHRTADGQMVPTTQRARVTYIQAEGIANAIDCNAIKPHKIQILLIHTLIHPAIQA